MLPINDPLVWLRQSAATLRAGGADASAIFDEEIAERLESERSEMAARYRGEIAEARARVKYVVLFGPAIIELIDEHGLAVVPRRWWNERYRHQNPARMEAGVKCQSDPK